MRYFTGLGANVPMPWGRKELACLRNEKKLVSWNILSETEIVQDKIGGLERDQII